MKRDTLINLFISVVIGGALWFVVNLEPDWLLAWIVPGALFWLALQTEGWASRGYILLAAFIGALSNFTYFRAVMPLPAVLLVLFLQSLLMMFVFGAASRVVKRFRAAWTILALPVIAVAADTALAHFTPDGNWGSLGYTQAGGLVIAQFAAVAGVGGILFVLMLFNSALGFALQFGTKARGAVPAYAVTLAVVALVAGFGYWRLQTPVTGTKVTFGMASVDDYIVKTQSDKSNAVWSRYAEQVGELAAGGAQMVLLPEKIDVLSSTDAKARQEALATAARDHHVWLVAGLGVNDGKEKRNEAWWYSPDGALETNYQKHFMAPPEREFVPGNEFPVNEIGGVRYGVAICKDMHFASLARGFAAQGAGVMLVPAWDFDRDAWMAANMTKLRGVESGFTIVRSSRDGLLSVSDAYGRMVAVKRSESLPGATLLASADVGARVPTIYSGIGDLLGWICIPLALFLIVMSRLRRR